jgi:hypothetical protein
MSVLCHLAKFRTPKWRVRFTTTGSGLRLIRDCGIAGDWQGFPFLVLAPQRGLLRMAIFVVDVPIEGARDARRTNVGLEALYAVKMS